MPRGRAATPAVHARSTDAGAVVVAIVSTSVGSIRPRVGQTDKNRALRRRLVTCNGTRAGAGIAANPLGESAELAVRTVKRRARADPRLPYPRAADAARLACAAIDEVLELEIAGRAVGAHVVAQRAAAFCDRRAQHCADRFDEPAKARLRQSIRARRRSDALIAARRLRVVLHR